MIHVRSAVFALRYVVRLGMAIVFAFLAVVGVARSDETKTLRTDLYGDPLPPGAVARLGTIRLRHAGADVMFSKDGKQLISCGTDGEVRIWDTASGQLVSRQRLAFSVSYSPVFADLVLSPGGGIAAVTYENSCYLYDTNTGRERGRISSTLSDLECLWPTFSPDGKVLAVQEQARKTVGSGERWGAVQLWDVARIAKRQTLAETSDCRVAKVVFSADSKRVAGIVESYHLYLWDVATGKVIRKLDGLHNLETGSLVLSPDDKTLMVGDRSGGKVWLFDTATLKEKAILKAPANVQASCISWLAFSPNGGLLAGVYDDGSYGRSPHHGMLLWDLLGSREPRRLQCRWWSECRFAPDGKTLVVSSKNASEIALWDVASGRQLHRRTGHGNSIRGLATSPDGKLVASSDGEAQLRLWNAATGELLHALRGADDSIFACLISSNGQRLASASSEGTFQIWDIATGKELRRFRIDWSPQGMLDINAVALSTDGKRLAAVATGGYPMTALLFIYDVATGKRLKQRLYKARDVRISEDAKWIVPPAAFTPDGERVSMWLGDRVGLEEVSTGIVLVALPKGVDLPMAFSPDGRLVAATVLHSEKFRNTFIPIESRKGISLIETVSGEEVFRLNSENFDYAAFTPDGRGLVVTDRKDMRVWDTATGELLHRMEWPDSVQDGRGNAMVRSLAVLPGGRAATGMYDGYILVWNLAPGSWPARRSARDLGRKEFDNLWTDLAGDARKAYPAIHQIASAPDQACPYLGERLHPATEIDQKFIHNLLADLDSGDFSAREKATQKLAGLCDRIDPMLRRALSERPSLELRRRLENILAQPHRPSAERMRMLRAIAVLERIATPEARRILEKLAGGAASPETRAAEAALQRLKYR